jgi:hypothetical protein
VHGGGGMKELTGTAGNFSLMLDVEGKRQPTPTLELIIMWQEPVLGYAIEGSGPNQKVTSIKRFETGNLRIILQKRGLKNLIENLNEFLTCLDKLK